MRVSLLINFNHIAFNNQFYLVFFLFLIGQKCIFYYINSSKTPSFSSGVEYTLYIYIYIYIYQSQNPRVVPGTSSPRLPSFSPQHNFKQNRV